MRKKDFSNLENQIKENLKNTFDAIDFARLKEDINNKTEKTLHEAKTDFKNKSQYFNDKIKDKISNQYKSITNIFPDDKNEIQMYISKRPVGSISGILYIILGFLGAGILGSLLIAYSIFSSFFLSFSTANAITLGLLFSFFISNIALGIRGIHLRKRLKRFKQYVKALNNNTYCSIDKLAFAIGKKKNFVAKDLKKMIDLDMFVEAHIDDSKTYFMLNDEAYEHYLNSQESLKHHNETKLEKQKELNKEINDSLRNELKSTIELGKNYIEQIKSVNNAIHKEEMSTKLYKLQNIINQIFNYLESNPKKLSEVKKFTNHYLPITLKLVNSYKDLNDQVVQGDNIKNAKNEIEKTIDLINTAFEKLLDDLFGEVALDISTDISVLETLFTQEGLTKNDFKK